MPAEALTDEGWTDLTTHRPVEHSANGRASILPVARTSRAEAIINTVLSPVFAFAEERIARG